MKLSELIGKRIVDIKDKIEAYDSGNELLTSSGIIKLESGEIFEIPYRDSEALSLIKSDSFGYTSIFNEDGFFKKLFSKFKYDKRIANRNKEEMKGKAIVGIYQYDETEDDDEYNELEKMIIEVESGYMISEIEMSPFGTGAAGLIIFPSKKELISRFDNRLRKIH